MVAEILEKFAVLDHPILEPHPVFRSKALKCLLWRGRVR